MAKTVPFTNEQVHELERNPFTHSVTPDRIVFTLEFKIFFLDQIQNHGLSTKKALMAAGYHPEWFTLSGRDALRKRILDEARSEKGLQPPKGLSTEQKIAAFEAKNLSGQKTDVSIREMQERIVHLEKQVEFLKKISNITMPVQQSGKPQKFLP